MIDTNELKSLIEQGYSVQKIADHFNVTRIRIYQLMRSRKLTAPKSEKLTKAKTVGITVKISRTTKDGNEISKSLKFRAKKLTVEIEAED